MGKEEDRAKSGLGDIRLGYKCGLSVLSRPSHGLLLLSSISLLCSSPALPNLLLHSHSPSSTSSPHVQNTWVYEISHEPFSESWCACGGGWVRRRSFLEGEGQRSEGRPGLQAHDCFTSPWNLSCSSMASIVLCQMILTDSVLRADSMETKKKKT